MSDGKNEVGGELKPDPLIAWLKKFIREKKVTRCDIKVNWYGFEVVYRVGNRGNPNPGNIFGDANYG